MGNERALEKSRSVYMKNIYNIFPIAFSSCDGA